MNPTQHHRAPGEKKRRPVFLFICTLSLGLVTSHAAAQFLDRLTNPQISVTLEHPPGLEIEISRVAFGPSDGTPCSNDLADASIEDFLANGVEVIDRKNLESILLEHNFNLSEYVDRESATQLGSILGPSAMIFVSAKRCITEEKRLYRDTRTKKGTYRTYISRTNGYLKGSVRVVDLSTGRIFAAQVLDEKISRENRSDNGYPEFPSEYEILDSLINIATVRIHRMFFRWNESKDLYFFNDKKCNLKSAYRLVKAGNYEQALEASEANLEFCKSSSEIKPKVLAHAYYNVGMTHFILGNLEAADQYFVQSIRVKPMKITTEAAAECQRAKQLAAQMQRLEDRIAIEKGTIQRADLARKSDSKLQVEKGKSTHNLTIEERLEELKRLYEKNLLTEEEYRNKREEILESF